MGDIIRNLKSNNIGVQILCCLAMVMEKLGSLTNALNILKWAFNEAPNNQKLYLHASRLYLKRGQVDKAVFYWKRAAGQENIGSFLYWLNTCREKQAARKYYGQPVQSFDQTDERNLESIGLDLLDRGYAHDALTIFMQLLGQGKADAVLFFNIGYILSKLDRHGEAVEYYEKAQSMGLNNPGLLNNKGYSLFLLNRFEEAQTCYELARGLDPNDYDILNNLAACYIKTSQQSKALEYLKRVAQNHPGEATLQNNLAMCLEATGQTHEAVIHYDRALQWETNEKNKKVIALNKIKCLVTLEKYQEALSLCDSLPAEEHDYELWGIKGELLNELGRISEAAECYRMAFGLTIN